MKIDFVKQPGGVLIPASDEEAEKLVKFKTGAQYEVDIKYTRNPSFHGKVFAFFNFCFQFWAADKVEQLQYMDESGQKDVFRKWLTCKAGYYNSYFNPDGGVRIEAKSLSFGNMSQEEFELQYMYYHHFRHHSRGILAAFVLILLHL